jgi:5-methyltetrahydropteroyltriglutamate--homocysteine methyltransferase
VLRGTIADVMICAVLQAIDGLDADVLTIENSRSGDEMLRALAKYGYSRDIGAGVYDVHSPVVPP